VEVGVQAFFGGLVALIVLAVVIALLNRFYLKSTRDTALIRTGSGGQRIVLDGGVMVWPFLHRVDEINMRTQKFEVSRTGDKSLLTEDRLRVDLDMEFHVRVAPDANGVATAAQAFGPRTLRSEDLGNLLSGRFIDAMQTVASTYSLDALHEKRGDFSKAVRLMVGQELASNGLVLESASIVKLDQTPPASLSENNAFNAVGLRRLAEIVASSKKKRAQIEAEADVAVRQTHLDALKAKLQIDQQQQQAELAQRLELELTRGTSEAEMARSREQSQREAEQARIAREREIKTAEIARDRLLDKERMQAMLATEVQRVDQAISLARKQSEEAQAAADTELARLAVVLAQEKVSTERERAAQQRLREIALMKAKQQADVDEQLCAAENATTVERAKAQALALREQAQAQREQMLAESEGKRALVAAENSSSEALMRMKLEMYRLDRLPEITAQMMKPVEKIDSIRIHQFGSLQPGAAQAGGNGSAVNQAVSSILDMALQMPVLKRIGDSLGVDLDAGLASVTGGNPAADSTTKTEPKNT
jgi:flotillin